MLRSIPGTHGDGLARGTVASTDEALATRQGLDDCRHLLVDARELGISGRIESAASDADEHGKLLHSMRPACRPHYPSTRRTDYAAPTHFGRSDPPPRTERGSRAVSAQR